MEFGRQLRSDGLLRLKQPTSIAGQDVSKNLPTFAHDEPGTARYADVPSALVVTARSTSCETRSRTWVLGILIPLTLPARNNSVARLVISVPSTTGTKTQVPENPLFDTFTLTWLRDGASTWRTHSRASRAVKHLLQTASALVTKISKRVCTLLDQQHPQRLKS